MERGLKLLDEETARLGDGETLAGEVAFKLYDTYGFPLDLTRDILRGQARGLDEDGFEAAMERQRAAARKAWAGSGEVGTEALWFDLRQRLGATEFLGYATECAEGQVVAILAGGAEVECIEAGQEALVLVNQTPFYGESGGQMGDSGLLESAEGSRFEVRDTQKKLGDLHVHIGTLAAGSLAVGDAVTLTVDGVRRAGLRGHHSATHLLHEALRRRLGDHVTQKGSLVAPDRLRFDISHPKAIAAEDLAVIEAEVNQRIRANAAVETRLLTPEAAIEAGALALFGEKYGEEVRVVSMGGPGSDEDSEKGAERQYSTELCGGTHVSRSGDIGFFKILGETALAAGVRRIEAVTGQAALDYVAEQQALVAESAAILKAAPQDLPARISQLVEERKRLEKQLGELRHQLATGEGSAEAHRQVAGVTFAGKILEDVPARELKPMADALKKQVGSGVVALVAVSDGKASLVVGVTPDLTERLSAIDLVRAGSAALGGKGGGGRPDMAQAGGPNAAAAAEALAAIEGQMASLAAG